MLNRFIFKMKIQILIFIFHTEQLVQTKVYKKKLT